jgi:hypothetical protein
MSITSLQATPAIRPDDKLKPEDVVAKHLESIGTAEARSKHKSHIIIGVATGTFRLGGSGTSQGGAVLASQGEKSLVSITYNSSDYPFERVGYDGKAVRIGEIRPGVRSTLGLFFIQYNMPIAEGLLGGTLSTAWPLHNLSSLNAKLKYSGIKKAGDQRAHVLSYSSKNDSSLKVNLYFDETTFRHIRTEYERRQTQGMPNQPGVTQQQGDSITKLVEDFSDFKPEGGLMLPHTYKLTLSIEALTQRVLQDWVFQLGTFNFNQNIADSQFDVRTSTTKS